MELAGMAWADVASSSACEIEADSAETEDAPQLSRSLSSRRGLKVSS